MTDLEREALIGLSKADKQCGYAYPPFSSLSDRGWAECLTDGQGNVTGYRITPNGWREAQQEETRRQAKWGCDTLLRAAVEAGELVPIDMGDPCDGLKTSVRGPQSTWEGEAKALAAENARLRAIPTDRALEVILSRLKLDNGTAHALKCHLAYARAALQEGGQ